MKNIKIILIGLVLLFSGCVETVEVPKTEGNVTIALFNISLDVDILCYTTINNTTEYYNSVIIPTKFIDKYSMMENKKSIQIYDGINLTESFVYPYSDFKIVKNSNISYDVESCYVNKLVINYNLFRNIEQNVVSLEYTTKGDYLVPFVYSRRFTCFNGYGGHYDNNMNLGLPFDSLSDCMTDSLSHDDFIIHYTEIVSKYRWAL